MDAKSLNKNNLETLNKFTDYLSILVSKFRNSQSQDQARELSVMSKEMVDFLREEYQAETLESAKFLISKLKKDLTLSPSDLALLESYIIGDALTYTKTFEPMFLSSLQALYEYSEQIKSIDVNSQTPEYLIGLMGKAQTMQKIMENINSYLERKNRIDDFRKAINDGIDKKESALFADLIDFKIKSPNC
jgi:hypothetical protein